MRWGPQRAGVQGTCQDTERMQPSGEYSPLETAEVGMCWDMGRKRPWHPQAGACRGRDLSGMGKGATEERALTSGGHRGRAHQDMERKRARGTHKLGMAEKIVGETRSCCVNEVGALRVLKNLLNGAFYCGCR